MPELLTIEQLKKNSADGLKQAEALYYKQAGIAEFVASLKQEGYELVKQHAEPESTQPSQTESE